MQGNRPSQEDRHVKIPDLAKAARALKMPIDHLDQPCALFAVYDGHCGQQCSDFAAKGFHTKLLRKLSANADRVAWTDDCIEGAIRAAVEELDADFIGRFRTAKDGSTILVVLLVGQRCFVAWAGDSRGVLAQQSAIGDIEAAAITEDHRPSNESEAKRIVAVGGEVVHLGDGCFRVAQGGYEERVLEITRAEQQGLGCIGNPPVAMAVSRSLGDRDFKAVTRGVDVISATPELRVIRLEASHKFLVLMSDGLTDVMTDQEVVDELDRIYDAKASCTALVQEALRRGSGDNVTAILVRFEWRDGGNDDADAGGSAAKRRRVDGKLCTVCGAIVNETGACGACGVISG